jgi:hypothetical protein
MVLQFSVATQLGVTAERHRKMVQVERISNVRVGINKKLDSRNT